MINLQTLSAAVERLRALLHLYDVDNLNAGVLCPCDDCKAIREVLAALATAQQRVGTLTRERDEARRVLANVGATVDAITDILNGKEPSDFLMSFPLVRSVWDLKAGAPR